MRTYQYDEAGNIEMVTTVTDAGSSTDARTHNDLNQIEEQVVGGDTWTFSYDDNGNMTGKTDGTDTWTYSWNDENRLVRVQGPGSVDIAYSYDSMGRMLTRDDGGPDITQLTWHGWNCIKEVTGESETIYHIPEGQILSLTRDGVTYQAHSDPLGSVRMVTDDNGQVVARYEYGAFGNELPGSFDSVPGGMAYKFVGGLGCRTDPTTSLVYMRHRWYDPTLGRFVNRDPIGLVGGKNMYAYCGGDPISRKDPDGLEPHRGEDAPIDGVPNWGHVVRQATMDAKHRALQDGEYAATVIDNHKVDIVLALTPEGWVEETVSAAGKLLAYFRRAKAATATVKMYSRINESSRLVRYAEQATTNKAVQVEMDALFLQLSRGNMNPGSGTKFLFNGVYEARSAGGARLYFRNSPFGVEILGKSSKANQSQVINTLREMYGK